MQHNLRQLPDHLLIKRTEEMVKAERETSLKVLELLLEVERRRLFASQGFSSLYDYCTRGLGYTEAEAVRRISSMRLLKNLASEAAPKETSPEIASGSAPTATVPNSVPDIVKDIESKLENGKLSLSVLAQAQSFFSAEAKAGHSLDLEEKKEVLNALTGKSTREATRELQNRSSLSTPPVTETTRPLKGDNTEIKMVVDQETWEALEKIKGLLAHVHPKLGWGELVSILSKIALEKLDPAREPARTRKKAEQSPVAQDIDSPQTVPQKVNQHSTRRIAIPAALERKVWQICDGRCTFTDPVSARRCSSQYCLEIEHIIPIALGGSNELSNLSLHCRLHNQYRAIQEFGLEWMEPYLTR